MGTPDRTYEVSTGGPDPSFQLQGSDPFASMTATGLMIPTAPTTSPRNRYLFALCGAAFPPGSRGRVRGIRQLLTIGGQTYVSAPNDPPLPPTITDRYNVEFNVTTPTWRFSDGSVSWHLMRVPNLRPKSNVLNAPGLLYRNAVQNALLYETLAPYVAPYGGRPPGQALVPSLSNWHDMRYPWQAWGIVDAPFEGPCQIILFASVWQTNPDTRATFTGDGPSYLPPEEGFLWGSQVNAIQYKRIAGSLIFDEEQRGGGP